MVAMTKQNPSFFSRFKLIVKFLLFREDAPKHKVAGPGLSVFHVVGIMLFALVVGCGAAYMCLYGFLAMCMYVVAAPFIVLEMLHIIFDR